MKRMAVLSIGMALLLPLAASAATERFDRDLYFGLRGDADVVRMQEFLRSQGYFSYPQSTGNYLTVTLDAVRRWQEAQGISPVGGYFGPQSRAAANKMRERAGGRAGAPAGAGATVVPAASGAASPHKGKIVISYLYGASSSASGESLTLENRSKTEHISITGFRVQNKRGGSLVIPRGDELPGFSVHQNGGPIILKPGDRAVITLGKQERGMNFRENLCTGYFDESSSFSPWLDHSCPRPSDPDDTSGLSDRCVSRIRQTSSCRMMRTDEFTDSACSAYADAHLTYNGCVRDNRDRADFYGKRWLVWMQRDREFFSDARERVTLLDADGEVVDEYQY